MSMGIFLAIKLRITGPFFAFHSSVKCRDAAKTHKMRDNARTFNLIYTARPACLLSSDTKGGLTSRPLEHLSEAPSVKNEPVRILSARPKRPEMRLLFEGMTL
ncbi:hypothetical protein [Planktotalea sp.]|uniref:hypothetical protein n=1 Tax=Planktotalea sp. TaxID=2029877 RepID=UPI003D6AFBD8